LSLKFKQLNQPGKLQEFQESLSREYLALVSSALWAYIPVYSFSQFCYLLMFTALTLVPNTALHRFISPLPLHCTVPQLHFPFAENDNLSHPTDSSLVQVSSKGNAVDNASCHSLSISL